MCSPACLAFGQSRLVRDNVAEKTVIEIGSRNVNGSLRPHLLSLSPSAYVGIDICRGSGVDILCDVKNVLEVFGIERFDIVLSTEMLEHVADWRTAISNMKHICKPGGLVLLTTRSPGFPRHDYPNDYWRFSIDDMQRIFADMNILDLESDPSEPGVFLLAQKPLLPVNAQSLTDITPYCMSGAR
jgi:SAM-dependent methyltransferase